MNRREAMSSAGAGLLALATPRIAKADFGDIVIPQPEKPLLAVGDAEVGQVLWGVIPGFDHNRALLIEYTVITWPKFVRFSKSKTSPTPFRVPMRIKIEGQNKKPAYVTPLAETMQSQSAKDAVLRELHYVQKMKIRQQNQTNSLMEIIKTL